MGLTTQWSLTRRALNGSLEPASTAVLRPVTLSANGFRASALVDELTASPTDPLQQSVCA
jgi:hypothetical protein